MAYEMYLADWKTVRSSETSEPLTWEQLTERQQTIYLRHVDAALTHMAKRGDKLRAQYTDYIQTQIAEFSGRMHAAFPLFLNGMHVVEVPKEGES
jgi:hypothetical protein